MYLEGEDRPRTRVISFHRRSTDEYSRVSPQYIAQNQHDIAATHVRRQNCARHRAIATSSDKPAQPQRIEAVVDGDKETEEYETSAYDDGSYVCTDRFTSQKNDVADVIQAEEYARDSFPLEQFPTVD
jgi:hypothetical protein